MLFRRRSWPAPVAAAICTAIALLVQTLLTAYAGPFAPPFLAFFPAIVAASLLGGASGGWLTLAASAVPAGYFMARHDAAPELLAPQALILALFVASGALIVVIASAYRRSLDVAEHDRERLLSTETRLRLAHEAAKIGTWEYVVDEDRVIWSPDMFRLFELDPTSPAPTIAEWRTRLQLNGKPADADSLQRDLRISGKTVDRELRILTFKGRSRWLLGRTVAVGERGQAPSRFIGVHIDITERKMAEEREQLLAHELDHRAKNMLAMVQSIVQLTREEELSRFREAVTGRIQSLARSHNLLVTSRWHGADVMHLVRDELEPFMGRQHAEIKASGPRVNMQPSAAQTLALLIHELATNAVKYGALSTEAGRLAVYWRLAPEAQGGALLLTWTELGGPTVKVPRERGFGSRLIVSSVERQLNGKVVMNWLPSGLHCEVTVPAEHLAPTSQLDIAQEGEAGLETANEHPSDGAGRQILLVEDEALIAMQAEKALLDAGYAVIGPVTRIGDAPEVIANNVLDGAILDINLNGERSFAIADLLVSRHVPFMFCTGFTTASILPDRFRHIAVIVKPFGATTLLARLKQTLDDGPRDLALAATPALEE